MKKIYLHIGQAKTGSTAIQTALTYFKETGILEKYDFDYLFLNHELRFLLSPQTRGEAYFFELFEATLVTFLQNTKAKNCIISSEFFSLCEEIHGITNILNKYFKKHNLSILLYLRRQDRFFESFYAQSLKWFEAPYIMEPKKSLLKPLLKIFAQEFGKENIQLRVFEKKKLYQNDVIYDFLEWVDLKNLIPLFHKNIIAPNLPLSEENLRISRSFLRQNQLDKESKKKYLERQLEEIKKEIKKCNIKNTKHVHIKKFIPLLATLQRLNHGIHIPINFIQTLHSLFRIKQTKEKNSHAYLALDMRQKFLEDCAEENQYILQEFGENLQIHTKDINNSYLSTSLFSSEIPTESISLNAPNTDDLVQAFLPMLVYLKQEYEVLINDKKELETQIQILKQQNRVLIQKFTQK